jgi:hypothetical protein
VLTRAVEGGCSVGVGEGGAGGEMKLRWPKVCLGWRWAIGSWLGGVVAVTRRYSVRGRCCCCCCLLAGGGNSRQEMEAQGAEGGKVLKESEPCSGSKPDPRNAPLRPCDVWDGSRREGGVEGRLLIISCITLRRRGLLHVGRLLGLRVLWLVTSDRSLQDRERPQGSTWLLMSVRF